MRFGDRYRSVPERCILDMLLLGGFAYDRHNAAAEALVHEALGRWIDLGLGFRRHAVGRLFDPVEVLNVLTWAGLEAGDGFWAEHYVATGRRLVQDLAARVGGQPFEVTLRRTFYPLAKSRRPRFRLPLPLSGTSLGDLRIEPFAGPADGTSLKVGPGRLEARPAALTGGTFTLGARMHFTARPNAGGEDAVLDDRQAELYRRPREGLIVVSARVAELARSLAPDQAEPREALCAFWNHILDALMGGAVHYDQVDADAPCDWVLDTGWCDCQLAAALFVALCRARNIPARIVSGHVLYRRAPTNHYWAEAWLAGSGWMPFDFLSWNLSRGGRDAEWRDHFFGRVDARMTTQIMPLSFTGAVGVPIPADFLVLQTAEGDGIEISLLAADGTPVYRDQITLTD